MEVRGVDHIHILVPDLKKAIAVAEALVGGASSDPYGGEEWNAWASYHKLGGFDMFQPINMDEPMFGYVKEKLGVYILAFRVDDIDYAVDEVKSMGLPVVSRIGSEEAGFGKLMLQAQLERHFGAQMELVERGLPDDPLHCPMPDYLNHIEFYVHDVAAAAKFFTSLTGSPFPQPTADSRLDAVTTTSGLGVRLTEPASAKSAVAQALTAHGEGVRSLGIVTNELGASVTTAGALGLRQIGHYQTAEAEVAVLDPDDFFGISIELVQRRQ